MPLRTLELLESLMSGHEMSADELQSLLTSQVKNDLFLDYKHGKELKEGKKARRTMRQYLSGFANSSGGVLIVGVDDKEWGVTGCSAPGGGDLTEWAASCLTPIAPQFSPMPRFQVVHHPNGDVLVAAVQRSLTLVYCVEDTRPTYYLRLHDETLSAPDYLISDLVLGRRQDAHLHIGDLALTKISLVVDNESGLYHLFFNLNMTCQNLGLAWAWQPRLGFVAWTLGKAIGGPISEHLLSYIEVRHISSAELLARAYLSCGTANLGEEMPPFSVRGFKAADFDLPLSIRGSFCTPYTWLAVLYLMSKNSAPVWYQVSLALGSPLLQLITEEQRRSLDVGDLLQLRRVVGERPVVAWDGLRTEQGRG